MTYNPIHPWDVTPAEAVALQQQMRQQIRIQPLTSPAKTIAGCDISFNKYEETVYAGIVVLDLADLSVLSLIHI